VYLSRQGRGLRRSRGAQQWHGDIMVAWHD